VWWNNGVCVSVRAAPHPDEGKECGRETLLGLKLDPSEWSGLVSYQARG
jgi:hypothetical protein